MSRNPVALPAMRHEFPTSARVRVGEFDGKKPVRKFEFDIAAELETEGGETRYKTHPKLMQELARALGYQTEETDGRVHILEDGKPIAFKPRRIPIELLSDDLGEFFSARLARWRRSGPDCVSLSMRPKTAEELAFPAQVRALELQGLPTAPSGDDFESIPELWMGECERFAYTEKEVGGKKFMVQSGRTREVCDPLTCPHFRSADPKQFVPCKPDVRFNFRLPWTGQRSWAWFCSTSWNTARRLATTLADIAGNTGGILRGVPCLLVTQPITVRTPDGSRQKQPVVYVGYDRPVEALRAGIQSLLALEQKVYNPQLALPPRPETLDKSPSRVRALVQEFHPEAAQEDVELVSFEADWRKRAVAAGATIDWVDSTLDSTGGDEEAMEAALESLKRGRPKPEKTNGQGRLL